MKKFNMSILAMFQMSAGITIPLFLASFFFNIPVLTLAGFITGTSAFIILCYLTSDEKDDSMEAK